MKTAFGLLATLVTLMVPAVATYAQNDYKIGPDSEQHPGVPQGTVTHYTWTSKIYPGTVRSYWVYVPKQYVPSTSACVMICQDGGGFQSRTGGFRLPNVLDNLIERHEAPVTIGIMIEPGVVPAPSEDRLPRYNRSYEYDAVTDVYARFLLEEILPEVGKSYNLTNDPNGRAICGASSGGICAFTAAWLRPDAFRRVISYVGSFTDLRGGNGFPPLIRKTEPKPLRVFLQDGSHDQDIYSGSWPIGNQDLAAALKFAGYDYQLVVGTGGHDGVQGTAIFPDAVRWIWRDYPTPIATPQTTPQPIMKIALHGEDWKRVGTVSGATAIATDSSGVIFYAVGRSIYRLDANGQSATAFTDVGSVSALAFSPDGSLLASISDGRRLVRLAPSGSRSTLAHGVVTTSVVVLNNGDIYVAEPKANRVTRYRVGGDHIVVESDLSSVNCLQPTPDQSLLIATHEHPGKYAFSYSIGKDGSLANKQAYFDLETPYGAPESGSRAMSVDSNGWLYIATDAGLQVLDQAGRVNGVLLNPERRPVTSMTFGGEGLSTLFVVAGGEIFARKTQAHGVLPFLAPMKPPGPRL